ncbi:MAG: ammonium transporter [Planctomycetaceae bacterium]
MNAFEFKRLWRIILPASCGVFLINAAPLFAQEDETTPAADIIVGEETVPAEEEEGPTASSVLADVDTLWTCLAAFLVFFMQAGFALVEAGFTRAKNACNIIMKNLMDFSIGSLSFWLVGFGLMFGASEAGLVGTSGFLFDADADGAISSGSFGWAFLIFQTVFAATAATIVSGAMAERTKFVSYLVYSVAITVIVYPIFGSWCWNGLVGAGERTGWLETMGFLDFAGSTVVHSVGGWCALAGAIVIGARRGKYKNGKPLPMPGHNIPLAALGVFILWLGWFGFNPGSTTAVGGGSFAKIAVTTNLSAAAGAIAAMMTTWVMFKKPDVSFALNGALAGLVAITAGCDIMSPAAAVLTGAIGGVLVVFSCLFIERIGIDDPVGAVSVHGVCGVWGTLAIGLLSSAAGADQLLIQGIGVAAAFAWAFPVSFVIFSLIKVTVGLRVSEEEEMAGLDITEHGMHAYPPGLIEGSPVSSPVSGGIISAPSGSPVPAH